MAEALDNNSGKSGKIPSAKILLWLGIGSIVILFAALTSAYIVREAEGNWTKFEMPAMFWISTSVIIFSSVFMNWALASAKKNNFSSIRTALIITLMLGLAFVVTQFLGWKALVHQNIFFAGSKSNPAGSFFYVITGLHVVHLLAGLLYLLAMLIKAFKNKFNSSNLLGLELCATYWHFLGGLWVYLFLFLLFIR